MVINIPNMMIDRTLMFKKFGKGRVSPKEIHGPPWDTDFFSFDKDTIVMGLYPFVYSFHLSDIHNNIPPCAWDIQQGEVSYSELTREQLIEIINRAFLDKSLLTYITEMKNKE